MTAPSIHDAWRTARQHLLGLRNPQGVWRGRLCSSPLAGAVVLCAYAAADRPFDPARGQEIEALLDDQNPDAGWGDTPDDPSNPAATLLAAFALSLWHSRMPEGDLRRRLQYSLTRATGWTATHLGPPATWGERLLALYDNDKTFPVPILTTGAVAGLVSWDTPPGLPFELGVLPHAVLRFLRLGVVSYALPALIAIGLVLRRRRNTPPLLRAAAAVLAPPALRRLQRLQPQSGGFIEASPLTAFVVISLCAAGERRHPVVERALAFLDGLRRKDGRYPVDLDLACWLTSLSVAALAVGPLPEAGLPTPDRDRLRRWLLAAQWRRPHPYTGTNPGGWGWTDTDGAVPDADDTAAALTALHLLNENPESPAVTAGVHWLLRLQNADGGWPTFCRGWQRLPFDRSDPALTAHAVAALLHWRRTSPHPAAIDRAVSRARAYLRACQRPDGSWNALWFGSPWTPDGSNPVIGTALTLRAFHPSHSKDRSAGQPCVHRALRFLLTARHRNAGWGAAPGAPETVEETACAVAALARFAAAFPEVREATRSGALRLVERIADGSWRTEAPIGLYFARLRYSEMLYPVIWTVGALGATLQYIAL